jgi:hypothetical protein
MLRLRALVSRFPEFEADRYHTGSVTGE